MGDRDVGVCRDRRGRLWVMCSTWPRVVPLPSTIPDQPVTNIPVARVVRRGGKR